MKTTTSNHTTKNPFRAGSLSSAALITLTAFAVAGTAQAATETWDGGHGSVSAWFANLNWADNTAPVDFDDLVFTGTARLSHSSYGNFSGTGDAKINSITFDAAAGAFVISNGGGGTHKMLGDITNDSTNLQTINFPFQLNADVTANAAAGDITIGGVISEDGSARSLIKSGSNTLSLTGASTYTGTTDINAGKLQLGNGGTTGSLSTSSAIDIASNAAFMVNRTDTVTQGTDFSSAAITGAGYIVNAGDGTLVLDRANSHTGGARIGIDSTTSESATRVLQVTHSDALGTGRLEFFKSGTFELGADALTISNNVFSGNYSVAGNDKIIKLDLDGANTGTMSGTIDTRGGNFESFKMDVGAADTLTLSGNIYNGAGGNAGITKIGDGTLIMSGTNTYNGQTRVNAGTLKLSGGSAIEDIRDVFVDASGTLDLNGSSETINRLTGTGTIDTSAGNSTLTVGHNGATFQFDGTLTDTVGALKLSMNSAGQMTLTGASTYSGGTDIYNGTIVASDSAALGTGQVYMGVTSGATQTLAIGADGVNIANNFFLQNSDSTHVIKLDSSGVGHTATISGNMTNQVTYGGKWDFVVGADDTLTVSGVLQNGGAGGSGIDKDGAGTLVLSGANTYKGATRVNEGTLSLASGYNHSGTGAYTVGGVAGGGTLKIADGVDISTHSMTIGLGGVISPGNSPGTAITGAQTWEDGGAYLWEIDDATGTQGGDAGWDWLDITGDLTISATGGGFTIDIDSLLHADHGSGDALNFVELNHVPEIDYSFIIATTTSGTISGFDASAFTLDDSGFTNAGWLWSIRADTNNIYLDVNFVPEPSSTALLGLGLSSLLLRRKRS